MKNSSETTKYIVVYQRPDFTVGQELTTNPTLTAATLEAQGFIIIDILDVG